MRVQGGFGISEFSTRRSSRLRVFGVALLCLVLLAAALFVLWWKIPPRVARLLPECDAIAYADVKSIRVATHFDEKPVAHSAEYQQFIDATGIVVERDVKAVAFALTRMPDPKGPNGPVAFSEVFSGRFDAGRLTRYLAEVATGRESYAGHEVFTMPVTLPAGPASHMVPTGRTLRVAVLDQQTVVASNAPTPEQIHAMLDRARTTSGPFSGPTLLGGLYGEIPYFSSVWGIGALGLPFAEEGHVSAFGLHLPFPDTTTFVASLRYTNGLGMRIEQIAATEAEAARSVQRLTTLVALVRQMQRLQQPTYQEALAQQFLNSLTIEQHQDRAVLTAKIPMELVKSLTSAASPALSETGAAPSALVASK